MSDTFISRFTPSSMEAETLEQMLVQRQRLATYVVERVRESALTASKHHTLLVGPRGIGKTHMVALAYHRVKAMDDVLPRLRIAWLREEEWGIASFLDLVLRILRALHEEYDDAELEARTQALYALSHDDAERTATDLLTEYVGERTLWVLIENLDDVFEGLGREGQQQLRAYIQNHENVTLLATSQSLANGISDRDEPFYGFFATRHLGELSLDEAAELLQNIAHTEGDDDLADFIATPKGRARIRAVHHLAGGSPRIYVILSQFLTRDSLDDLVGPFMKMLDELTPYYQARMQWLSPQQRKLVEVLIDARGAIPVKEIAQQAFIKHQTVSGQLTKLRELGYVRDTKVGREAHYELREPLMRLCMEVKRQRNQPIRLFVDFLRIWYSREELEERLSDIANPTDKAYITEALTLIKSEDNPLISSCVKHAINHANNGYYTEAFNAISDLESITKGPVTTLLKSTISVWSGDYDRAVALMQQEFTDEKFSLIKDELLIYTMILGNNYKKLPNTDKYEQEKLERYRLFSVITLTTLGLVLFAIREEEHSSTQALESLLSLCQDPSTISIAKHLLISQIPQALNHITDSRAWLEKWQTAAQVNSDLRLYPRLLEAAIDYRETGDERVLLRLPIEERKLLEPLLEEAEALAQEGEKQEAARE